MTQPHKNNSPSAVSCCDEPTILAEATWFFRGMESVPYYPDSVRAFLQHVAEASEESR